jgi:hypothetical protein
MMNNVTCVMHAFADLFMEWFTPGRQKTTLICLIGILIGIIACRCAVIF